MSTASDDEPSMKLQIVVNKKKNRVMFAEANKEFVDFIFHILSFPLGAVHRILSENTSSTFGSISTLQEGLMKLDDRYIEDSAAKDYILHLKAPFWGENTTKLLSEASWHNTREFRKSFHRDFIYVELEQPDLVNCEGDLEMFGTKLDILLARGNEKGYVKEIATYMVMDDLEVRPAEPAFLISLMSQHAIKDVSDIEKREVNFGNDEAVKLLKASLSSKTVLTNVFLRRAVVKEEH